jgi:uncharacterized membrane protein
MVLDLRPHKRPTLALLWPTALSNIVSYVFIAIVWLNHHHLLRFAEYPTLRLMWITFVHFLMLSLVPFATAWVASTRLAVGLRVSLLRSIPLSTPERQAPRKEGADTFEQASDVSVQRETDSSIGKHHSVQELLEARSQ